MPWFPCAQSDSNRYRISTASLLASLLALSSLVLATPSPSQAPLKKPIEPLIPPEWGLQPETDINELSFSFRHILHHGGERFPGMIRRKDIRPSDGIWIEEEMSTPRPPPIFNVRARNHPIQRLSDRRKDVIEQYLLMSRSGMGYSFSDVAWIMEDIKQPNVAHKGTVVNLARMTANAYVEVPGTQEWLDVGKKYNSSTNFGWDGDGLRGHIFVDSTNSTIIISLKGTSPAVFDGEETTTNDKVNDNLLFSCCCARVGYFWKTVCDCYSGKSYQCGKACLTDAILHESTYYRAALNLYYTITKMYPSSQIWLAGHSLGGAVSALLGMTYGLPVIAFEAPGEALAASRIGIPVPPGAKYASGATGVYHFGHTADPIFMGTCNGRTSPCSIAGYAMETKCHGGSVCLYDTVNDLGWRLGLGYHRILVVVKDILEKYERVPTCIADTNCTDCYLWTFKDRNDTTTTATTTATTTLTTSTTTTTCKTKGFWGCLDETTTTTTNSPTTTTTTTVITTTSTCTRYNWYWKCIDKGTTWTFTDATTTTPTTTTTLVCTHRGWLGRCLDARQTLTTIAPSTTVSKSVCTHKGWFGHCLDPTWDSSEDPAPSPTATIPVEPTDPPDDPW